MAGETQGAAVEKEGRPVKSHVPHRGADRRLDLLLRGGEVVRYHTEGYGVEKQLVSDHTWRLLVILLHLWPQASRKLILAALYHDVAECHTGDLPSTLKRVSKPLEDELKRMERAFHRELRVPWPGDLILDDHVRLKCADLLELYITCVRQSSTTARGIAGRERLTIIGMANLLPKEYERRRVLKLLDDVSQADLL